MAAALPLELFPSILSHCGIQLLYSFSLTCRTLVAVVRSGLTPSWRIRRLEEDLQVHRDSVGEVDKADQWSAGLLHRLIRNTEAIKREPEATRTLLERYAPFLHIMLLPYESLAEMKQLEAAGVQYLTVTFRYWTRSAPIQLYEGMKCMEEVRLSKFYAALLPHFPNLKRLRISNDSFLHEMPLNLALLEAADYHIERGPPQALDTLHTLIIYQSFDGEDVDLSRLTGLRYLTVYICHPNFGCRVRWPPLLTQLDLYDVTDENNKVVANFLWPLPDCRIKVHEYVTSRAF